MEDDVRSTHTVKSSDQLTDWLLKYKLSNISYLSAQPPVNYHSRAIRKGSGLADKDVRRPTTQLFKNITQIKKHNASPSPQRKVRSGGPVSPTKEYNKIFNHKSSSDQVLESYRKIYVYGKSKVDRVSRDKIETAISLYKQLDNKHLHPEKNKKIEISPNSKNKQRQKSPLKICKPSRIKVPKFKQQNLKTKEIINKDKHEMQQVEENNLRETRISLELVQANKIQETQTSLEQVKEDRLQETRSLLQKLKLKPAQVLLSINNKKNEKEKEKQIKIEEEKIRNKKQDSIQVTCASDITARCDIIQSLRSKSHKIELFNESFNSIIKKSRTDLVTTQPVVDDTQSIESNTRDSGEVSAVETPLPQSVDDLIQAYRIKYRNMIKMR